MKQKFIKPLIEVIEILNDEIITTSSTDDLDNEINRLYKPE